MHLLNILLEFLLNNIFFEFYTYDGYIICIYSLSLDEEAEI